MNFYNAIYFLEERYSIFLSKPESLNVRLNVHAIKNYKTRINIPHVNLCKQILRHMFLHFLYFNNLNFNI